MDRNGTAVYLGHQREYCPMAAKILRGRRIEKGNKVPTKG